jgi:glycosyltransferase involved in cell wall biosynthesis
VCYDLPRVRILLDYRPALTARSGVGEYAHHLATSLVPRLAPEDTLTVFSSSWKDRLPRDAVPGARHLDARVPVGLLNLAWHRLAWPPIEWFSGAVDIAQSMHPLLLPARKAVRFITIHDLYFLDHGEHTTAEIRRDYPALVGPHARAADGVVVNSSYTKQQVQERLGVAADRIVVCPLGAPAWPARVSPSPDGPILFVGTIEPRKNVSGLLRAYERLIGRLPDAPPLVIAGRAGHDSEPVLAQMSRPPLAARVRALGYVTDAERQRLYAQASLLVLPSFDEGFGLPVLEAMTMGVPVVAARRGALPEVVGDAGLLVDTEDDEALAAAMERVLTSTELSSTMREAGIRRAAEFTWDRSAERLYAAYKAAVEDRG